MTTLEKLKLTQEDENRLGHALEEIIMSKIDPYDVLLDKIHFITLRAVLENYETEQERELDLRLLEIYTLIREFWGLS